MASVIRGSDNFDSLLAQFDAGKSLATNGYQKLSNGLILQWGKDTQAVTNGVVTFPITFPNNVFTVTDSLISGVDGTTNGIHNVTASKFDFNINSTSKHLYWMAIGN